MRETVITRYPKSRPPGQGAWERAIELLRDDGALDTVASIPISRTVTEHVPQRVTVPVEPSQLEKTPAGTWLMRIGAIVVAWLVIGAFAGPGFALMVVALVTTPFALSWLRKPPPPQEETRIIMKPQTRNYVAWQRQDLSPEQVLANVKEKVTRAARNPRPYAALESAFPNARKETLHWLMGAWAEERTGYVLENLSGTGEVAHDLRIMKGSRVSANIDHLVTGTFGNIMVDAKSWRGITGLRNGKLSRIDYPGDRHRYVETVAWEASHIPGVRAVILAISGGEVTDGFIRVPGSGVPVFVVEVGALEQVFQAIAPATTPTDMSKVLAAAGLAL